jgi:uncharacterized membrane protein YfcA
MRALKRALLASAALFAALLTFLSLQMLLGRDPSVRTGTQARAANPAPASEGRGDSLVGTVVGVATSILADGDDGEESSAPAVRTKAS